MVLNKLSWPVSDIAAIVFYRELVVRKCEDHPEENMGIE